MRNLYSTRSQEPCIISLSQRADCKQREMIGYAQVRGTESVPIVRISHRWVYVQEREYRTCIINTDVYLHECMLCGHRNFRHACGMNRGTTDDPAIPIPIQPGPSNLDCTRKPVVVVVVVQSDSYELINSNWTFPIHKLISNLPISELAHYGSYVCACMKTCLCICVCVFVWCKDQRLPSLLQ